MTIMTGQPLAHSLNSEPDSAAMAFSCSTVNTESVRRHAPARLFNHFLRDRAQIDQATIHQTEQDREASGQPRAAPGASK
jgi:hypothetical protein